MSEWKEYKLGEVYSFSSGLSKSSDQFGYGYDFLTFKDVFNNIFLPDHLTALVNSTEKEQETCSIKRGDVFLTRTSETDDELGMSSVALKDYPNATFNGFTKRLRPIGNVEIYPEFVAYYFRSKIFRANIVGMSSITTRASLNNSMLAHLPIFLPNIDKQIRIASILKCLDDKIDLLNRENATLEAMAETLFRQWFIEEAKEDWEEGRLGNLIDVKSGFAFKSSSFVDFGLYRLITIKAVQDGFLTLDNADYISEIPDNIKDYCFLKEGDILLSLTGNVGRCCLVDRERLLLNQRVALLYAKEIKNWAFVYTLFRMQSMKNKLEEMAKGTAQPNLSPVELSNMQFEIPPTILLEGFSEAATPLLKKTLSNNKQIQTLIQTRNGLLPKLMSNEINI